LAEAQRIVREVAAAVGLAEGEAGVRAILATLARLEPVSIRRISRAAELPVPIVASVCGELRKRAVVAEQRPAQLTARGRALFSAGGLRLQRGAGCPACRGRGTALGAEAASLVAEIDRLAKHAPPVRLELDQCHCTVETKLRRVLAIHEADALVGRRVLFLGDDDLTSLAVDRMVRRFGSGSTIEHLGVVDIDAAIIRFVRRELAGARFPVSTLVHDLRQPLPRRFRSAFDTVVTDPPYTIAAARLFLSRAADALDRREGDVFLSFGSKRPEASFRLQQAITEMGFAIRRLTRDFNEYVGAGVLGGTSHLYHLTAARKRRPAVNGAFRAPMYTAHVKDRGSTVA
jgi:N4-bis(aminopropyl)spermidine synthase